MGEFKYHEFLGMNSLMAALISVICLFLSHTLHHYKVTYVSESGAVMLFGLLIGGILSNFQREELSFVRFAPELFFYLMLPPLIFEAGFFLRRNMFFDNLPTILLLSVLGTAMSTFIMGAGLWFLASWNLVPLHSVKECFLFGVLISSVDPVGTLSMMGWEDRQVDPMLRSFIVGESVLNDAISVVLYKAIENIGYGTDAEVVLSFEDHAADIVATFCGVWITSLLIGCTIALIGASVLINIRLHENASLEFIVFLLFAYASYNFAEIMEMSGIVSLFFCGIMMEHYACPVVSEVCQICVSNTTKSFAKLSESFVYVYLGVTAGLSFDRRSGVVWSFSLSFYALVLCFIGRACSVFPICFLANLNRKQQIPLNMQVMIWFAGLRGAISFALAVNVPTELPGQPVMVTTTLFIIFFTTLVMGGLTDFMMRFLELDEKSVEMAENNNELLPLTDDCEEFSLRVQVSEVAE